MKIQIKFGEKIEILFEELVKRECYIDPIFSYQIAKGRSKITSGVPMTRDIHLLGHEDIGFVAKSLLPEIREFSALAKTQNFSSCPSEAVLRIRLDYWDQPEGEDLYVITHPYIPKAEEEYYTLTSVKGVRYIQQGVRMSGGANGHRFKMKYAMMKNI